METFKGRTYEKGIKKHVGNNYIKEYECSQSSIFINDRTIYDEEEQDEVRILHDSNKIYNCDEKNVILGEEMAEFIEDKFGNIDSISISGMEYGVSDICRDIVGEDSNYIIVSDENFYKRLNKDRYLNIQGIDLANVGSKYDFTYAISTMSSVSELKKEGVKLKSGHYPEASNEIIVSKEYASVLENEKGKLVTEYRIPKINDGTSIIFADIIGWYVKIVGIYDENELEDDLGKIIVNDDIYEEVLEDYYKNYAYMTLWVKSDDKLCFIIEDLYKDGFYINDFWGTQVYGYGKISKEITGVWIAIYIILIAMIMLVLIMFLTDNVKREQKRIGIFKAIGVYSKDIKKLYMIKNFIVCFVSATFGMIFSYVVMFLINKKISQIVNGHQFVMFDINYIRWCGWFAIILAGGLIITYMVISKLLKDKSITLINGEE